MSDDRSRTYPILLSLDAVDLDHGAFSLLCDSFRTDVIEPLAPEVLLAARPGESVRYRVLYAPPGVQKTRSYGMSDRAWERALAYLAHGEIDLLAIDVSIAGERDAGDGRGIVLSRFKPGAEATPGFFQVPARLQCVVAAEAFGGEVQRDLQAALVEFMMKAMALPEARRAFIGRDLGFDAGGRTPYEYWARLIGGEPLATVSTHVRGFFWMMSLTGGQIARLGGRDHIMRNAPGTTTDLSQPEHELIRLQLTDHIDDVTDDHLRALRDFLLPVLLPKKSERILLEESTKLRFRALD